MTIKIVANLVKVLVMERQQRACGDCSGMLARTGLGDLHSSQNQGLFEDLVFMCRATCGTRNCLLQMRRKCSSEKKVVIKMLFMCA